MVIIMIIKARQEHLDKIIEIESICFPPLEAASKQQFLERYEVFHNHFIVAIVNDQVVGFMNGAVTNEPILPDELYHDASLHDELGKYQTVFGIAVLPEYQHKGIASDMMNYFIELAKLEGREGIVLTCKDCLVGFYERFGYKCLGVSDSCHGGSKWNDMLLLFKTP